MTNCKGYDRLAHLIKEKSVSKSQAKFMGIVHAIQKGDKVKNTSPEAKKAAKTMKKKDVKDFASTSHKGLPDKVTREQVKESLRRLNTLFEETQNFHQRIKSEFGREIQNLVDRVSKRLKLSPSVAVIALDKYLSSSNTRIKPTYFGDASNESVDREMARMAREIGVTKAARKFAGDKRLPQSLQSTSLAMMKSVVKAAMKREL